MAAEGRLLLRSSSGYGAEAAEMVFNLDDEVVQEALKSGVDLRNYSKKIEEELKTVEHDAVQDYIKEAENIANLHHQIRDCDSILLKMEEMLGAFQSDLGSISSEIQSLQEQSVNMNVKLKNRQSLRSELSQFIDELSVTETMIELIEKLPASDRQFLEQLHELQHKITFAKEQSFRDAKSCDEVVKVLDKLKIKAIEKIREYLLQKIYLFRKPLINYQIPQNALLKFRFYYEFLLANERRVAEEIQNEYIETLSKVFWSYFKTYAGRLMKLQMDDVATKEDVLGAEDVSRVSNLFTSKPNVRNKATVFTVGQRNSVLNADLEAPIIVTHAAEEKAEKFQFEALFRSMNFALADNSCREFLFLCDFFMVGGTNAFDLFHHVIGKSLKILIKSIEAYVVSSYDCIALILCIHIVYRYQSMMHKRDIRVLDGYWETLLQLFWPRFEQIFTINADSIRDVHVLKVGAPDARPHYIVRRYAEFASALAAINQSWPDERLQQMLQRLQIDVEGLLTRLSGQVKVATSAKGGAEKNQRKQQLIFLINNYDLILSTLMQNVSEETSETLSFQELMQTKTAEYIEELLTPYFGPLMNFVVDCERLIEQGHQESLKRYVDKVAHLIRAFGADWKRSIEQINQEVVTSFSSLKQGSNVLQQTLTQLIQYYHRFNKILGHPAFVSCTQVRNDLVNIHHIMVEVKKYKPTF